MTHRLALLVIAIACLLTPVAGLSGSSHWLYVDTEDYTLSLMDGSREVRRLHGISIGRGGTALYRRRGDEQTPIGAYRIAWINEDSRFGLFLGLSYPTQAQARQAYETGAIDGTAYEAILLALERDQLPPQDTALGGHIGIHGLGQGDRGVHSQLNWTEGCVAVTNEQIKAIRAWVEVGDRVVIDGDKAPRPEDRDRTARRSHQESLGYDAPATIEGGH